MKDFVTASVLSRWLLAVPLALVLCGAGGCQSRACKAVARGSEACVLPPEIAGRWAAEGQPWEIVLDADGTVSSAVIALGEVEIKPNTSTTFEMIDGQFSKLEAGDCTVEYHPWTRELAVCIEMKHIRARIGDDDYVDVTTDIKGSDRIINSTVDMGAYEYDSGC